MSKKTARERETRSFPICPFIAMILSVSILPGCATKIPVSGTSLRLGVESVETEALDQNRVEYSVSLSCANDGTSPTGSLSVSCSLYLDDIPVAEFRGEEPVGFVGGESRNLSFKLLADVREIAGKISDFENLEQLPWTLIATVRPSGLEGGVPLASVEERGTMPLVRDPKLTIESIVLVRHELINVLLELVLDVHNPNSFPVTFAEASYQFYGEGRRWSSGTAQKPVLIPARGSAEVRLPIVLNFTETGRDLFDLVAKLKVVRYRLSGEAKVLTEIPFLPEFRMRFDESGATRVERVLPSAR